MAVFAVSVFSAPWRGLFSSVGVRVSVALRFRHGGAINAPAVAFCRFSVIPCFHGFTFWRFGNALSAGFH